MSILSTPVSSAGESKQRSTQRAASQRGMRSMGAERALSGLWAVFGDHAGPRGRAARSRRALGTGTRPRHGPGPTMPHCSARAACETRGKRVCFARWALLSYQRRRHNRPGVLTILPSGESKPWPGSKPAGETCCRTAWLVVTMAPLPWWLMAPEDAASPPAAWLYRTPAKQHQVLASPTGTPVRAPPGHAAPQPSRGVQHKDV